MHMGNNNQGTEYNLGSEVIPHGKEEKDLGVIITEDGKYSRQCAAAANKGMCKLRVLAWNTPLSTLIKDALSCSTKHI